jgi:group I intron endonuclease
MKIIGIYKITNPVGRIYIGQSVDIYKRWNQYRKPVPKQPVLHQSFKMYGYDNHKFDVIEICEKLVLDERELYWYNDYNSSGNKMLNMVIPGTYEFVNAPSDLKYDGITSTNDLNKLFNGDISTGLSKKITKRYKKNPLELMELSRLINQ